jgi:hypothetical protein
MVKAVLQVSPQDVYTLPVDSSLGPTWPAAPT